MSTSLWHPFADMHAVQHAELVLREGDGIWVTDVDGNRFLDATASLWYCNVGFGRDEIADAVADQLRRLPAYSSFGPTRRSRPSSSLPGSRPWRRSTGRR